MTGPPTEKWALVDVAHNNTRGSSQRLREKREKIRQATRCPSSESDQAKALEQRLAESKDRLSEALQTFQETEQRVLDAERRNQELVIENGQLQEDLQRLERRAQLAEQQLEDTVRQKQDIERELEGKTKELAAHNTEVWRIPGRDVSTVRNIGTGGWGGGV